MLTAPLHCGQILVQETTTGHFVLSHRDDKSVDQLKVFRSAEDASNIAKYDDAGNYRSLKTASNLRHGWRLELDTLEELRCALDYFYPGRLAIFAAWKRDQPQTTPFGNLECTASRQKFPIRRLMISLGIFADPMADVCAQSCGSAT
ncbi:MAG: hypothetical protein DMF02_00280 [Verrucomicrobia bacterium]|nr:MAG: hypothetical protein DMF02_00280 [Verrucomicrobiota bacterium]